MYRLEKKLDENYKTRLGVVLNNSCKQHKTNLQLYRELFLISKFLSWASHVANWISGVFFFWKLTATDPCLPSSKSFQLLICVNIGWHPKVLQSTPTVKGLCCGWVKAIYIPPSINGDTFSKMVLLLMLNVLLNLVLTPPFYTSLVLTIYVL